MHSKKKKNIRRRISEKWFNNWYEKEKKGWKGKKDDLADSELVSGSEGYKLILSRFGGRTSFRIYNNNKYKQ
jgi:hypothetical protein